MKESFFTAYLNVATIILIGFFCSIVYRIYSLGIIIQNDLYDIGITIILLFLMNILRKNTE